MQKIPSTNILRALENILNSNQNTLPTVFNYINHNRINSTGDLLEYYVKDAFCGKSAEHQNNDDKLKEYQKTFSYLGNSNNPPDFVVRHGVAVEVKKIEGKNPNGIALNSSFPKDYLHRDDIRIKKECRDCEDEYGGWTKKDMIYAIGNVGGKRLYNLWLVYGDCYCANKTTYERIANTIKDGVSSIPDVDFGETKELGRVNKVDPLGITYLRIRGMWGIEHPSAVFKKHINPNPEKTNVYVLMTKEKHSQINEIPDFTQFIDRGILSIQEIQISNPNNPAKNIDALLYSAVI